MGRSPSKEGQPDYAMRSPIRRHGGQIYHRPATPLSLSPTATQSNNSYSSSNPNTNSYSNSASYTSRSINSNSSSYTSRSINSPSISVTPIEEDYYIPVAPIPIFSGDSNECPFMHMIRFDHVCQANGAISPSIAARIFPASLDSKAALWYHITIHPDMPWEEVRSAFLLYFRLPNFQSKSELFSLRQSNEESVNSYHLRMQLILNRWLKNELSEEVLKTIFIDGLREELKEWVSPQGPKTLDEAFRLTSSWEEAEEIRELRTKILKNEVKCGFCGVNGHEEEICEARKKMRELFLRSSFKGTLVKREGKVVKVASFKRQCSCEMHQCFKKVDRSNSVKSDKDEFYDVEEG